ncbi:MAG: hypothetical protein H5T61_12470 [Thermoflexales bacterium]|nr:hypothetical protein [Thermoflexales bacterium]
MGTVLEWVDRISALAAPPAVAGLVVALGLVLVARRWALQVIGMAAMYFVVGVLHTQVIRPEVVLVKLLVGAVVCLALGATGQAMAGARRNGNGNEATDGDAEEAETPSWWKKLLRRPLRWPDDAPLRALALGAALLAAYAGSLRFPLPQVPSLVGLACYLLGVVGLFLAGMAEEPLGVGLGLLVFLNGFDLFFGALEPSLVVAGLLGLVQFLITLAVAYLALARTE